MTMRIGTATVDALIDGEAVMTKDFAYPDVPPEAWAGYDYATEGYDGDEMPSTLGAFLIRDGERVILIDAGIGPHAVAPMVGGAMRGALLAHVTPDQVT